MSTNASLNDSAVAAVAVPATEQSTTLENGSTHGLWNSLRFNQLCWLPELGCGYFPVTENPYNDSYFANYAALADTDIGRRLNAARVAMVARHWLGPLIDVGIGAGTFVESRPGTFGFDINPAGVAWLRERGLFASPYIQVAAVTLWDSLEHIIDPSVLLANVRHWAFVSIPIFRNLDHLLGSKHFKKAEHAWYFLDWGFVAFMDRLGWQCVESNDNETQAGREDIRSYAFRRVS